MLTYENFILDIFKKKPIEFMKLGQALVHILEQYYIYINDSRMVRLNTSEIDKHFLKIYTAHVFSKNSKNYHPDDEVMELYYYDSGIEGTETIVFHFLSKKNKLDYLEEFIYFIEDLMKSFIGQYTKYQKYKSASKSRQLVAQIVNNMNNNGQVYFIPLSKVQSIIDEMTIENLDLFIDSKKYNL